VAYVDDDFDGVLDSLAARISPRVLRAPLDEPRRELDEYLSGKRRQFELSLDWQLVRGFGRRVLEATARIPYGSVSSYKQVATEAGSPRASRAAGNALGANPLPIVVPCHRILHSTGGLGGYTGGLDRKRALLALESGQGALV
jgi:methylated-DNA-[protein]-cysteine S-methyltransferase